MKTLKKIFAILCLATMFFAVSCSSDDDSESKSQTEKTGGNQNPPAQNPPQQTPENPPEELPPKSAKNINQILIALGAQNGQATSFKPSATAPASGVETKKIHDYIDTAVVWLDGTTIYYYAEGYTDSGKGIPLGNSAKEMFRDCKRLETIDMSGFDTRNVTDMRFMFFSCERLTSLNISNFNTSNVTYMNGMFRECNALTALDLSNFNTSNVTYMSEMFSACNALTALNISNFDTSKLTDMVFMFNDCKKLTSLDVSSFDTSNVTNMSYMFDGCEKLTTIYTKPDADWSSVSYSRDMFYGCTSLVGGNDNAYSSAHTNAEYARVDKAGTRGYFTAKQ